MPARARIEWVFGLHLPAWPVADAGLSFVTGFLLLDLLAYLTHRCEHALPFLWRFHALHHSDTDLDMTTAVRHHPVEYVFSSCSQWLVLILLDIPAVVLLCHVVVCFGMAAATHGNLRLPAQLERWLRPAIITTDLHRLHHSTVPAEASSNYGSVLSIWDRLFGTYARFEPERHEVMAFGVQGLATEDYQTIKGMILSLGAIASAD